MQKTTILSAALIILLLVSGITCISHNTTKPDGKSGTEPFSISTSDDISPKGGELFVRYNPEGLASIVYNNHEYYSGIGTFDNAAYIDFRSENGETYRISNDPYPQEKRGYRNDITRIKLGCMSSTDRRPHQDVRQLLSRR